MKCKQLLLSLGLACLVFSAQAKLPRDVAMERVSPTRIAVVWTGELAADEKLDFGLSDTQGHLLGKNAFNDVAGSAGRVELDHAAGVRPYVLIDDNHGHKEVIGERVLPLEGGINFRDVGGYRTADGRSVRWGKIYRSGLMADLTDNDYAYLQKLGIKTICDLRDDKERTESPTQAKRITNGGNYLTWDYQLDFDAQRFATALANTSDPQETAMRLMSSTYRNMVSAFAPRFRAAFDTLKKGDGLAFNCSAGKDRTGILAALVLTALGVEPDVVVSDYAMTQRVPSLQRLRTRMAASSQQNSSLNKSMSAISSLPESVQRALMGSDPMYISAAFDQIRADYGSIDAYLEKELGVTAADKAKLRDLYLEPAAQ